MSLLLEAIRALVLGGMVAPLGQDEEGDKVMQLVATKLKGLLEHSDPNCGGFFFFNSKFFFNILKQMYSPMNPLPREFYVVKGLGLDTLDKLLHIRPELGPYFTSLVLTFLEDPDPSIRTQCLDLFSHLTHRDNFMDMIQRLMGHAMVPEPLDASTESLLFATDGEYRSRVALRILDMMEKDTYGNVEDFEWALNILLELSLVPDLEGRGVGQGVARVMVDLCVRVQELRPFAVQTFVKLIEEPSLAEKVQAREVVAAAAWICGEYISVLDRVSLSLLLSFTHPQTLKSHPPETLAIHLQASLKVFVSWINTRELQVSEFERGFEEYVKSLEMFTSSPDLEVRERVNIVFFSGL
jgi:AP-3 complex subunit delta-1